MKEKMREWFCKYEKYDEWFCKDEKYDGRTNLGRMKDMMVVMLSDEIFSL